jgi:hypothetical protein
MAYLEDRYQVPELSDLLMSSSSIPQIVKSFHIAVDGHQPTENFSHPVPGHRDRYALYIAIFLVNMGTVTFKYA